MSQYASFCRNMSIVAKERLVHPNVFRYWPDVVAVDGMSRAVLLELQGRRLEELMRYAIEHVPFYQKWARSEGLGPDRLSPLEAWPVITKDIMRADVDAFQSDDFAVGSMRVGKTSGSTGEPLLVRSHVSAADYSYAVLWRALARHGLRPGDRRAYVWGRGYLFNSSAAKIRKTRLKHSIRDWINNTLSINANDLTDATVDRAIDAIERFRPVYLHGYVSALHAIAQRMIEKGRSFADFTPVAVITEAEMLYRHQREALQAAFRCPIREHYGSVECGNIAQEDATGRMRIAEDAYRLEALPSGEVLVTCLLSKPYPYIRYKLGDLVRFEDPPAGDPLPYAVLTEVTGRTTDLVPVKAGGYVTGLALTDVIEPHLTSIKKYQMHQPTLDQFIVKVVAPNGIPQEAENRLRQDLVALLGDAVDIKIVFVDEIPSTVSGKIRLVHSDVSAALRQSSSVFG